MIASSSTSTSETCTSDWLFSEARGYCDYPETVDCGDRPVCDDDDVSNCEERECILHCHVACPTRKLYKIKYLSKVKHTSSYGIFFLKS